MPYAPVRDLQMYYELHGPAEAEPLLLLNGAFGVIGPNSDWSNQLPRLAEQYHVVAFEHRGHNRTNNPAGRFVDYAQLSDDALALLDYLELPRVHVVGFSDGAITALDLVLRFPARVELLVLVGANYYNDQTILANLNTLSPAYMEEHYPAWVVQLEVQHNTQGEGHWRRLADALRPLWLEYPQYTQQDLSRITAPTLVMTGQYDIFGLLSQALEMHEAIKGSEIGIIPGASHGVLSQRPEISSLIILDFLRRKREKRDRAKATRPNE